MILKICNKIYAKERWMKELIKTSHTGVSIFVPFISLLRLFHISLRSIGTRIIVKSKQTICFLLFPLHSVISYFIITLNFRPRVCRDWFNTRAKKSRCFIKFDFVLYRKADSDQSFMKTREGMLRIRRRTWQRCDWLFI